MRSEGGVWFLEFQTWDRTCQQDFHTARAMEILSPQKWTDEVTALTYELLLSDTGRDLDPLGDFVSMRVRSLGNPTTCVADIHLDPAEIVGSGSFLSVRRLYFDRGYSLYDVLQWCRHPVENRDVVWRKLVRPVDRQGEDELVQRGWVSDFMLHSILVDPSQDEIEDIRLVLRELIDLAAPLPPA